MDQSVRYICALIINKIALSVILEFLLDFFFENFLINYLEKRKKVLVCFSLKRNWNLVCEFLFSFSFLLFTFLFVKNLKSNKLRLEEEKKIFF